MKENNDINNKKQKKHTKRAFRRLVILNYIVSIVTLIVVFMLNVLPILYFGLLTGGIIILNIIFTFLLLGKGWKKRLFGTILLIPELILFIYIIFNGASTIDFLSKIDGNDYNTENYSVIVLNSSNYNHLKDIKDKTVGVITGDDVGNKESREKLKSKISVNYKDYEDLNDLNNAFLKNDVDAILIEDAEAKILEDDSESFLNKEKVLYKFSINVKMDDKLAKNVDISKEPFNVFISGIDTYGKVTSVSRSDVNIVVSVNPKTKKILITSIPRDYFVKLSGIQTSYKDKLTHAGIHGIETSVKTVEDLLDININYYAKVNFTSLIDIVDTLGGITVDNDKPFRAYYIENTVVDYYFNKGSIKLNGRQALAYSRERKSLATGDIERNKHQQQVLTAVINKAFDKQIITKYNSIISKLQDKITTNIGTKNLTNFIKEQIRNNEKFEINTTNLTGSGAYDYTYSYKNSKAYVMIPNEESVKNAHDMITSLTNS